MAGKLGLMNEQQVFGKVTTDRAAQQVVHRIEVLVLEGVLRNGDKLPGERDLALEMNVSRPILRDALKILETKGILETRHGQGTVVADVIGSLFSPPIENLMRDYPRTRVDYVEFRRELEAWAASLAAVRASEDDILILKDVFSRMEEAHGQKDVEAEARLDLEFHITIADCAHNIILIHSLRSCYQLLSDNVLLNRERIYDFAGARDELFEQHRVIFNAIVAHDAAAASAAARDHMIYIESTMQDIDRKELWQKNAALRRMRQV